MERRAGASESGQEPRGTGREPPRPSEENAGWPYASLLLFGFFGAGTPEGKRLARRTFGFLIVYVVCALGLAGGYDGPFPDLLWLAGAPGAAVGVWWAYARYLGELDELSRAIQLKALAFAYGAAMTLMVTALAVSWLRPGAETPETLILLPLLAEGFRGVALVYLARQYR